MEVPYVITQFPIKLKNKIGLYHTVGTVPKSNKKKHSKKEAKSTPLTNIYIYKCVKQGHYILVPRIGGVMVSMLEYGKSRVLAPVGSNQRLKLVFVVSLLSTQHYG